MRNAPPDSRRVTLLLFSALVADMLAFTCILPLFPSILNYYSKSEEKDWLFESIQQNLVKFERLIGVPGNERYHNSFFGGLLGSLFSALQFVASPTLGALSDTYGRKPLMILSAIGTFTSYVVWLYSKSFSLFVLSRVIGGLSKANINVATAIITDVYPPEQRQRGMAIVGMSYSVGFLVGPMIGAFFSKIAPVNQFYTTPAYFSIVMTIIYFLIVFFALPETGLRSQVEKFKSSSRVKQLVHPGELFKFSAIEAPAEKKEQIQHIGWVYFLYLFLYAGLEFTLPFLTHERFGFDSMQQGKIYLFRGLLMLPIQGHFVRKTPMHRQKLVAQVGLTCIVPAFLLCAIAESLPVLYAGLALYAIASATVVTSLTCLVTNVYPTKDHGALAGVFRSLGALSRALGPVLAASVFWLLGPTLCYTIGAFLLLIPLYLARKIPNPPKVEKEN
ncbi:unnamed protein product, partial [Mesorhabditis belari]|uniref:Major facilitator superfamily (MFS) profile domain-containing protein n=1 Tax=Mesorhabditis belari TaxID=2138241 RepID=A0AAF3JAK8_9BILA